MLNAPSHSTNNRGVVLVSSAVSEEEATVPAVGLGAGGRSRGWSRRRWSSRSGC